MLLLEFADALGKLLVHRHFVHHLQSLQPVLTVVGNDVVFLHIEVDRKLVLHRLCVPHERFVEVRGLY